MASRIVSYRKRSMLRLGCGFDDASLWTGLFVASRQRV